MKLRRKPSVSNGIRLKSLWNLNKKIIDSKHQKKGCEFVFKKNRYMRTKLISSNAKARREENNKKLRESNLL